MTTAAPVRLAVYRTAAGLGTGHQHELRASRRLSPRALPVERDIRSVWPVGSGARIIENRVFARCATASTAGPCDRDLMSSILRGGSVVSGQTRRSLTAVVTVLVTVTASVATSRASSHGDKRN